MGANEKHAATYHGGGYVPPVRALRTSYVALRDKETTSLEEAREEFQRGIDRIRAEAKAEAWDECMSSAYIDGVNRRVVNVPNPYKENQS